MSCMYSQLPNRFSAESSAQSQSGGGAYNFSTFSLSPAGFVLQSGESEIEGRTELCMVLGNRGADFLGKAIEQLESDYDMREKREEGTAD